MDLNLWIKGIMDLSQCLKEKESEITQSYLTLQPHGL